MKIKILKKGDSVLSVSGNLISVQRKNGDVDIIPIIPDETKIPMLDTEHILTITYGSNSIKSTVQTDSGDSMMMFTF